MTVAKESTTMISRIETTSTEAGLSLNMHTLSSNLLIDIAAAGTASLCVSPFITVFDRSVIENASGVRSLKHAMKEISMDFIRNPWSFIRRKEFQLIHGVYLATYFSANAVDSICETVQVDERTPKFLATTSANISTSIIKDREFARMFGVITPTTFSRTSVGLLVLRDAVTVGASFIAPPYISSKLQAWGQPTSRSNNFAQVLCPASVIMDCCSYHG
jgi:hypothetical protein